MSKKIDVKDIIKKNLAVNTQRLAEVLKIVQDLRAKGITGGAEYNLVSPFSTHTFGHSSEESAEKEKPSHSHRCR